MCQSSAILAVIEIKPARPLSTAKPAVTVTSGPVGEEPCKSVFKLSRSSRSDCAAAGVVWIIADDKASSAPTERQKHRIRCPLSLSGCQDRMKPRFYEAARQPVNGYTSRGPHRDIRRMAFLGRLVAY